MVTPDVVLRSEKAFGTFRWGLLQGALGLTFFGRHSELHSPSVNMDGTYLGASLSSLPSNDDDSLSSGQATTPSRPHRNRRGSVGSLVGSPFEETFPLDFYPPQQEKVKVCSLKFCPSMPQT